MNSCVCGIKYIYDVEWLFQEDGSVCKIVLTGAYTLGSKRGPSGLCSCVLPTPKPPGHLGAVLGTEVGAVKNTAERWLRRKFISRDEKLRL